MLFYFIFLHLIVATPQLNLHNTDWVSGSISERDNALQHNCLYIFNHDRHLKNRRNIMSYCMSELPSKFNVQKNNLGPKFTFAELSKRNITSEDLYLWSTPIDIIEDYQLYCNELLKSNNSGLATKIYYNCTMPRFGPMCQYELPSLRLSDHTSLDKILDNYYGKFGHIADTITCYIHLQCNRGPHPSCLDWTEICNGKIDCLDSDIDEEHCWQLEINQCRENEQRCRNGQCISQPFDDRDKHIPECGDISDIKGEFQFSRQICYFFKRPSIRCEDVSCPLPVTSGTSATRSCTEERDRLSTMMMHSNNSNSVSEECWSAFKCLIVFQRPEYTLCDKICVQNDCKKIVMNVCPNIIFFPDIPVLFRNIYFVYKKDDLQNRTNVFSTIPLYVCYNTTHYDHFFANITKTFINNMTCVYSELFLSPSILSTYPVQSSYQLIINQLHKLLQRYHLPFNYTSAICNRSNMYQCFDSSKCISIYRLMNNVTDCPHMDDENMTEINNNQNIVKQLNKIHYKCETSNKYIPKSFLNNDACDCDKNQEGFCEDENSNINYLKRNISFQNICDRVFDLLPIPNGERIETDETECEQWQCNNIYTRCDQIWNCPNGVDEIGCHSHPTLNCSLNHHLCVAPDSNQFTCLPMEKANDGHADCLGATDEPTLCESGGLLFDYTWQRFYCMNDSSQACISYNDLCDDYIDCKHGDDEQFCETNKTSVSGYKNCEASGIHLTNVEHFLCTYAALRKTTNIIQFKLHEMTKPGKNQAKSIESKISSSSSIIKLSNQHQYRCYRGLDLRIWLNNKQNSTKYTCLCSPHYYGDQCQYQNQRISVHIRLQALSNSWQTLFEIVVSLIDNSDQRTIHSYEQFTYFPQIHCGQKLHIYLLYSTRPKNPLNDYAIHIDIYEKESLSYRGSLLYPIMFTFLPVHRLSFVVNIPSSNNNKSHDCSNDECIHGKCIKYYDNPQNFTFCQCDKGWSGRYCTIQHNCTCSSDSLCISISPNNRSICVCPMNKFGPRCLLTDIICSITNNSNSTCQNGGQCLPYGDYLGDRANFLCICPQGYSGDRCEKIDNKIILSFDKNIILTQSIFIHFFEVIISSNGEEIPIRETPIRTTTFQTILFRQDLITIYWSKTFHLIFTELSNKIYYLTLVQKVYKQSETINKTIDPSDRCPNITELFNKTFVEWPLIRRIKYYHLPCQNQSLNLSCFHDDVHLCLCYDFQQQRLANCFYFNHNMTFDCSGQSECENDAQCLQDDLNCPNKSLCICPDCFYGRRCQFSSSGFGLSLDAILGYHIIPKISLNQQQFIIKITLALTIIFITIGFINGILCIITFKNKSVCEVGCGLYLLGTSIAVLLIMIMLGLKFSILLLIQMTIISNRTFLQIQCHLIDFLLRICLCTNQWLDASVATERAVTVMRATRFNKNKSKRTAKFIIIILLISIILSLIHDPIHRHLFDEGNVYDNAKRTWCIVTYPSSLKIYDYFIHCFHFFGPCLVNLVSSIILIKKKSRQQLIIHRKRTYREILKKQIREHKHLLTGPIILFILALPRLVLTFISKCMKSSNDAWLFLIGYFISFIPSMLTFLLFIVPSKFYKAEFRKTVANYRVNIRRRLRFSS